MLYKNLAWCFGYNKHVGVLNLSLNETKKMFLASSHIGIVYNIEQNEQKLLEGHVNIQKIIIQLLICVVLIERWHILTEVSNILNSKLISIFENESETVSAVVQ